MGAAWLITGTDTGVGKTFFTCALARALVRVGRRIGVFKPLESGWPDDAGETDASLLRAAAGGKQSMADVCLYRFQAPLAPLVAAEIEGVSVDTGRLESHARKLMNDFDVVLIEGAGGLLSPLAPGWTILDLAAELELAAIVVAADRLGCLNHVMLTQRALESQGVGLGAVVMNTLPGTEDSSQLSNADVLRDWCGVPVLAEWYEAGGGATEMQPDDARALMERMDQLSGRNRSR